MSRTASSCSALAPNALVPTVWGTVAGSPSSVAERSSARGAAARTARLAEASCAQSRGAGRVGSVRARPARIRWR